MKVALVSLEAWDDVWRRNQHLAAQLVRQGLVDDLVFVEPVRRGTAGLDGRPVQDGIVAVVPSTPVPKTLGGLAHAGRLLRTTVMRGTDLIWINDPTLGVHCLVPGIPAVYDVTDDWREAGFPAHIRRRICRAENALATRATTIVCSPTLKKRWHDRYAVDAALVQNGVDLQAWADVRPVALDRPGPHVGYVGTLHEHRLDVALVATLAQRPEIGTVHLVGPNCLGPAAVEVLRAEKKVAIHGPVPAEDVPRWMAAMDVLVSPHLVNSFTLSLDAIKAYEYAASGRPVVATPTNGFPDAPGNVHIAEASVFARHVVAALASAPPPVTEVRNESIGWPMRARAFWEAVPHRSDGPSVTRSGTPATG